MFLTRYVDCFRCRKHLGFKADDGEGVGPIYCAGCVEREREDRAEAQKVMDQYRQAKRVASSG